ncbi:uncharacterized protein LOC143918083 [Arctopsyche grandis]|uniref:uncharacterized protein LOC143918083 n=1 Tax=Arctopsyche grandis TaxID=121162 RepID=UPI00406D93A8
MKMLLVLIFGFSVLVTSSPVPNSESKASTTPVNTNQKDEVSTKHHSNEDAVAEASADYDDSGMFLEPESSYRHAALPISASGEDHSIELQGGSQTFFPTFANLFQARQPLGHSRPITSFNQEGAYSQRPQSPLKQLLNYQAPSYNGFRSNDYAKAIAAPSAEVNGILGSGNFGVIRGGTFFSDSSDTESQYSDNIDNSYFNNNGHGRPAFYFGNSNPRPNYNQEQFSNFRDFADINAPSNSAYSHFVVVYANKNATLSDVQSQKLPEVSDESHLSASPKNIIERLAQIDEEQHTALPTTARPEKKTKVSKSKTKLALLDDKKHLKKYKKSVVKKSEAKDLVDPLLALS